MKISEMAGTGSSSFSKGMRNDRKQISQLKRRQMARSDIEDRKFQLELEKSLGFRLDKIC